MAAELLQSQRIASFQAPCGQHDFALLSFEAEEGLSELFSYRVKAASKTENADLQAIIGERCVISVVLKDGNKRHFNGILVRAQWIGKKDDLHIYKFTLRPWLWLLSRRADCRIFKDMNAVEIIETIFRKEGKSDFHKSVTDMPPKLEYCVQYRETDLDFVSRLMEKYGIYYYFRHTEGGHKLVLCDSRSGHDPVTSSSEAYVSGRKDFPLLPKTGAPRPIEHLEDWSAERRLRTGTVQLRDYDFKKSEADLTSRVEEGPDTAKSYERYDYPGAYLERAEGEALARIRVQADQAGDERRFSRGEAPSLFPGALMNLVDHPTRKENGEHLVVWAWHRLTGQRYRSAPGADETVYEGQYEFLKSDKRFRAPLSAPAPLIIGCQTARVVGVGNKGEEGDIDVDEFGRILLRFHWDREDNSTSARVRVAQLWSGRNWGGQIIPRIGQEVVVDFLEGNPDWPLVTGTVVNDKHMPPYELPGAKTQSGLKSESTAVGGGHSGTYNEVRFEDAQGEEVLGLRAEKDHEIEVQNKETRTILGKFSGSDFSRVTELQDGSDKLDILNGKLDITASKEIVMTVGQSVIRMLPASIEISSPNITIKSVAKTEVLSDAKVVVNGAMVLIN
jgi:type VI secretion system secreted protein VgrG